MNEAELFARPVFEEYSRNRQQLETVNLQLEESHFATSAVRQAYERAHENLEDLLRRTSSSPDFQASVAAVGEEAINGLEQLEPLENILPEEELAPLKADFLETIQVVNEFFERIGINSQEAEMFCQKAAAMAVGVRTIVEVAAITEKTDERVIPAAKIVADLTPERSDSSRKTVVVKRQNGQLQLGGAKPVSLSSTGDKEAGRLRWRALRVLIKHQSTADEPHETISPRQIWHEMGQEGEPPERFKRGWHNWATKVPYGKRKVVIWTGKRGRGSGYTINPGLYLVTEEESQPAAAEKRAAVIKPEDLYTGGKHLAQFDFLLEQRNIPAIDETISSRLEQLRPDYRHAQGNSELIKQLREEALQRFSKILSDEQILESLLASTEENAPQYPLFQYLRVLEPVQRQFLLDLMPARVERSGSGGQYRIEALDRAGRIVGFVERSSSRVEPTPVPEPGIDSQPETDSAARTAAVMEAIKNHQIHFAPRPKEYNEYERGMLDFLEFQVVEITQSLLGIYSPDSRLTRPQIRNVFPKFSTNMVKTAKDNNVVPRTVHYKFSIEDVIRIHLFNDRMLGNIYTARKYKTVVDEIIKTAMQRVIEKNQKELGGEDIDVQIR